MPEDDGLYFRQLLSGEAFATGDRLAHQMVNFVYAIGDRDSGDALLVDPAYDVAALVDVLAADGMRCVGVLATHYHPDHVGGSLGGQPIEGLHALLDRMDVPVHVQRDEVPWVERTTGVDAAQLVAHASGDVVKVGGVDITLVHTPGHTPGSQCFFVRNRLVSGDTLFLEGCGRVDLPGSDPEAMYESLTTRLARIPDDALLYPGHRYAPDRFAPMGDVRGTNVAFVPRSAEEWVAMFAS
jgi:glyoxylase-like metal-dependent hydrolase (beta-lactamase superfamily II)